MLENQHDVFFQIFVWELWLYNVGGVVEIVILCMGLTRADHKSSRKKMMEHGPF